MKYTLKYIGLATLILVVLVLALVGLLRSSCVSFGDGEIDIVGKAYEWVNAPKNSKSIIYIENASRLVYADNSTKAEPTLTRLIENIPENMKVLPLHNVDIRIDGPRISAIHVTSDGNGDFEYWEITAPGEWPISISANKEGYLEVFTETDHILEYTHVIVAVLVKKQ